MGAGRRDPRLLWRYRGRARAPDPPPTGDSWGDPFAGIGDFNADGFDDVAVHDRGLRVAPAFYRIEIYGGPDGRKLATLQGLMHDVLWRWPRRRDHRGYTSPLQVLLFSGRNQSLLLRTTGSLDVGAAAGDVNGDDFPDLLIGGFWDVALQVSVARLYSGAPSGVLAFGLGCADGRGIVPRIGASQPATLGSLLEVHVSRTQGSRTAGLLIGTSSTAWGTIPLPLDLGFVGMPGCLLRVSPDVVLTTTTLGTSTTGRATLGLQIPNDPALRGQSFFAQWIVLDPAQSSTTRGLQVTVQ